MDDILLHVSPTGGHGADGSEARPFPTMAAARDGIRALKLKGELAAPVRVLVEVGVYRLTETLSFTPEDSGSPECPITYAGVGGRPILSGGRAISDWHAGTLNGRPCQQAHLPEVAAGDWWFTQLFVNGRRRLRARLPKQGFYRFTGVPEDEARKDAGGNFHGAMSACFNPGELRAFRNLADVEVVVPDHWYENHLRIESVDEATGVVHFETRGHSRFSRDETGGHARFRVDNAIEGCTDPGDWALDRSTGTLYYIPLPGEDMSTALVEAPALDLLLSVAGDPTDAARCVRNLRFEFLDLRHQEWELPRENPGALQSAVSIPAAVRFVGAVDCAMYACRVSRVAGWAVEIMRGCHGNRIVACALYDLGGGGVKVGHEGGLPEPWVSGDHTAFRGMDAAALGWGPSRESAGGRVAGRDPAQPSATTVGDCSIHDGGLIFHSAIGVWVGDAGANRIVHNHIRNFNYSGISCGWTWGYWPAYTFDNRIEGNRIHDIGHGMLSDMGGIYTLGLQPGTTVRRNFIHGVHSYGYGGWGLYPDEGSSWMTVEENVVCATKCGGFHQHYGRDNRVRHNVFAEAVENQVQFSRRELVRHAVFENNLAQGAGNGRLWQGAGLDRVTADGNVYAQEPGRPAWFGGMDWADWRKTGKDEKGLFSDFVPLDASCPELGAGNPGALKAAGLEPDQVAAIVAEAGPRFRGMLPSTIDAVPPERETPRAIIEPKFWPWKSEWIDACDKTHPFGSMPAAVTAVSGEGQPVSLTLENRGDMPGEGVYRLRVAPAGAARIEGPTEFRFNLAPSERTALDAVIVPSGSSRTFTVEVEADSEELFATALYFAMPD